MNNTNIVSQLDNAMKAHVAWKMKLRTAIDAGDSEANPAEVKCDNRCEFGKWLYGPSLSVDVKNGMPFKVTKRLHAEFHESAAKVLGAVQNGKKADAEQLMKGEFAERSNKLARALLKWKNEVRV